MEATINCSMLLYWCQIDFDTEFTSAIFVKSIYIKMCLKASAAFQTTTKDATLSKIISKSRFQFVK